jgi:hypothetical protein
VGLEQNSPWQASTDLNAADPAVLDLIEPRWQPAEFLAKVEIRKSCLATSLFIRVQPDIDENNR